MDSVDYQKLNQVVTTIADAVTDVVFLLEHINKFPGTLYAAIDLANYSLLVPSIRTTRSNLFSVFKARSIALQFCLRDILPPRLCHNLV